MTYPAAPGYHSGAASTWRRLKIESKHLAIALARVAAENRCSEVLVLDLEGVSPVTDFFVIATGTSRRQMGTVLAKIEDFIGSRSDLSKPFAAEGMNSERWALIDLFDVIVHVFSPDARSFYALELLWGDAPQVDWQNGWQRPAEAEQ